MLKIHHLDCGSMCPFGGALLDGQSQGIRAHFVCHCLLIESAAGLILVDTGIGIDQSQKNAAEGRYDILKKILNVKQIPEHTIINQIQKLGFNSKDVRHIILTHLDFGHAGGLTDFPNAKIHVLKRELEAALSPHSWLSKNRYRGTPLRDSISWQTYESDGERWQDFKCVKNLVGLPPEILMVPLVGHSYGHCGVAIDSGSEWLLHAGDAYFFHREIELEGYYCPPGLRLYQRLTEADRDSRIMNQGRLRYLKKNSEGKIKIFSSHDASEFTLFKNALPH